MSSINIKDIAKLAGVGVSTVSRVINNHPDVKKETRVKIQDIIEKNNYIPNNSARNLKMLASNNIGIIVKGSFNPFFSKIVERIERSISNENYLLTLHYNSSCEKDDSEILIEQIKEKRLNGVIYLGGNFDNKSNNYLKLLNIPLVIASANISDDVDKSGFSSVGIDNIDSAFKAVDYLCKMGHKNIGLLSSGFSDSNNRNLRTFGYEKALLKNGISINIDYYRDGYYTFESGYEMAKDLLNKNSEITAIFSTSDIIAVGAAKYILSTNRQIPNDVSIIGFDGLEYGEFFHPSISTVAQPIEEIADNAVELLFRQINDMESLNEHIKLKTNLIIRDSIASVN
ncbi:LacI family DNA-binding transcriptional regulator [Helicovermis profundi]|uniref:LacI family DNA-binding transcriptional regulator n=1 Tax=Helicovermis profundi TaxID=3065157 RepID=A0AAU9DZY9_9FIRM|nr:LacI family DNA-binding transcriptional regulator [Clostridia bacterium S502]